MRTLPKALIFAKHVNKNARIFSKIDRMHKQTGSRFVEPSKTFKSIRFLNSFENWIYFSYPTSSQKNFSFKKLISKYFSLEESFCLAEIFFRKSPFFPFFLNVPTLPALRKNFFGEKSNIEIRK